VGGARVIPYENGPYLVRGKFVLTDQEGNPIETRRGTVALCRCGASRTKPFCDGTHKAIGFEAASAPEDQPLRPSENGHEPASRNGVRPKR
jgi:CDGSH-type Zn-finger protein